MPRPKLGESESKRLQMVITEDELAAIDDWQHTNRVPSKSEAIRRLIQIALRAQQHLPTLVADSIAVLDMAYDAIDVPDEVFASTAGDTSKVEIDGEIAGKLYDSANFIFNRQIEAQDNLYHLVVEISPLLNNPKLSEAMDAANERRGDGSPSSSAWKEINSAKRPQIERWREKRRAMFDKLSKGKSE